MITNINSLYTLILKIICPGSVRSKTRITKTKIAFFLSERASVLERDWCFSTNKNSSVDKVMIYVTLIVYKCNHSESAKFSVVYLYSALPPIVARLEKTLKSVMLSGQD